VNSYGKKINSNEGVNKKHGFKICCKLFMLSKNHQRISPGIPIDKELSWLKRRSISLL
jgi:hypothetical protein